MRRPGAGSAWSATINAGTAHRNRLGATPRSSGSDAMLAGRPQSATRLKCCMANVPMARPATRLHPRRVSRIAICNTSVWNPPRNAWDERIATVRKEGTEAIADANLERWFTPEFWAEHPDEMARVRAMIAATSPAGYAACAAAVRDADLRDMLGLIEAPTLITIGSRDPSAPPERGQYLVERIPGAQKLVLDCAHISNIECAEDFNRTVLGFLADGSA